MSILYLEKLILHYIWDDLYIRGATRWQLQLFSLVALGLQLKFLKCLTNSSDLANGGAPAGGGPPGDAARPRGLLRGRRPRGRPGRRLANGPLGGNRARQPRRERPQYASLQGRGERRRYFKMLRVLCQLE